MILETNTPARDENPRQDLLPIAGRHGGRLRRGGPNKGGAGRPPKEFKRWGQEIFRNPTILEGLRKKAMSGDINALEFIAKYSLEKPTEKREISQTTPHIIEVHAPKP